MSNGLDVALMKNPFGEWSPNDGDRYTDIVIDPSGYGEFYYIVLGIELSLPPESEINTYENCWEMRVFRSFLPQFPLLARVYNYYRDAAFAYDEIPKLLRELDRGSALAADNDVAQIYIVDMRSASSLALKNGMGIRLMSS